MRVDIKFLKKLKFFIRSRYYKYKNKNILKLLHHKYTQGKKIKVAFFAMYDSNLAHLELIKHLDCDIFEPMVIVIPDKARANTKEYNLHKTYNFLKSHYQDVRLAYDFKNKCCLDFSDEMDIAIGNVPYEAMLDTYYQNAYLLSKKILTIHIVYAPCMGDYYSFKYVIDQKEIIKAYKAFVESDFSVSYAKKYSKYKGYNLKSFGYLKMDSFTQNTSKTNKKHVMIAPHHTIGDKNSELPLSNFLKYCDFFMQLPKLYPDINFIFRPHPLLKNALSDINYWGKEKTDAYFAKISSYDNVEYQDGGGVFYDLCYA